jgi:histone-lysine N-methyltransferase SETD3
MSFHDKLKFNKGLKKKITDKNQDFFNFKKWLDEGGAKFPDLYFKKYSGSERGVHTKKSIQPNSEIIYIPHKLLITDELESKYSNSIGEELNNLPNSKLLKIALYILSTFDDEDNFYQPYYNILPFDISHLPIFWDQDMLDLLENSDFIQDIEARKRMLKREHDGILRLSDTCKEISLSDWMWVRSIVGSRNFSINVDGNSRSALVPLADMLNHYRPAETRWGFNSDKNGFTMNTLKNIKSHAQVMDSYGRKSNRKYLLHYGFVMDNNVEIDGKCEDDVCVNIKFRPNGGNKEHYITKDNFIDKLLIPLRQLNLNEEEMNSLSQSNNSCSHMVSKRNEVASLLSMANIARNQLSTYPKTHRENVMELKKRKGFSKERNAINFVKKQKDLLILVKTLADDMIPFIVSERKPEKDTIREEFKRYLSHI